MSMFIPQQDHDAYLHLASMEFHLEARLRNAGSPIGCDYDTSAPVLGPGSNNCPLSDWRKSVI